MDETSRSGAGVLRQPAASILHLNHGLVKGEVRESLLRIS